MPDYVMLSHLSEMIPAAIFSLALDDDGDGEPDAAAWQRVAREVKAEIDETLEKRCAVPFDNPLPALVVNYAGILAAEKIYTLAAKKKGKGQLANPFTGNAALVRGALKEIAAGTRPLYPTKTAAA